MPAAQVARDPFESAREPSRIRKPADLFSARRNSRGFDQTDPLAMAGLDEARAKFSEKLWSAAPINAIAGDETEHFRIESPATGEFVGEAVGAGPQTIEASIAAPASSSSSPTWSTAPTTTSSSSPAPRACRAAPTG